MHLRFHLPAFLHPDRSKAIVVLLIIVSVLACDSLILTYRNNYALRVGLLYSNEYSSALYTCYKAAEAGNLSLVDPTSLQQLLGLRLAELRRDERDSTKAAVHPYYALGYALSLGFVDDTGVSSMYRSLYIIQTAFRDPSIRDMWVPADSLTGPALLMEMGRILLFLLLWYLLACVLLLLLRSRRLRGCWRTSTPSIQA